MKKNHSKHHEEPAKKESHHKVHKEKKGGMTALKAKMARG